jgi:hypothetical protein
MQATEIDNQKFLLDLAKEVQIGEDGAKKSKAALKQGTSAADKLEQFLIFDQGDKASPKTAPKPNKEKPSQQDDFLFAKEDCIPETQSSRNDASTSKSTLPTGNAGTSKKTTPSKVPDTHETIIVSHDSDVSTAACSQNDSSIPDPPLSPDNTRASATKTALHDTGVAKPDIAESDADTPKKNESFAKEKVKLLNRADGLRQTIRNIEVEKTDLQNRIKKDKQKVTALPKKNKAREKGEKELEKAEHAIMKCETELKAAIAAVQRINMMVYDIIESTPLFVSARTGKGIKPIGTMPLSYTVEQYQHDIEEANEPADVIVRNKKQEAIPVYLVDQPKFITKETCPTDGFWVSQKEYANRAGRSVGTLQKYRETDNGAVWSPCGTWGKDKQGNIFKKKGDKTNSSYLYFVPNPK